MAALWHPFTQLRGFTGLGHVVRASGAWLELDDGRKLLDGIASWWVSVHGHCHPHIAAAVAEQAARLDQVILADFSHGPAVELTRRLVEVLPGDLDHVFFSDDGSTAVEVALKMAWQGQHQRGERQRTRFVALQGGYHGDTLGAMRVGTRDAFTAPFDDLLGETTFLPWGDAEAAEAFFAEHGHEVVACVVEPLLQGACGMRMAAPAWFARLAAAVQGAGAWLIADEVATGFGRTGTMFACEQAGVVPDLMCLSKGLTGGTLALGVTACRPHVFDVFLGDDKRTAFLHGHSFSGNPIACAAALASLDLFDAEDTVARLRRMEDVWAAHAEALAAIPGVRDVRWLGGVLAFDVREPGAAAGYHAPVGGRIQAAALAEGLYLRPLGDVVYLLPPACVTDDELHWACEVTARAVRQAVGG